MSATILAIIARLGLATLAFTLLAGTLAALRRPLRAWIGAGAVYALWLLVPLGVLLCCWPAHRQVVAVPMAPAAAGPAGVTAGAGVAVLPADGWLATSVLAVWVLGASAAMLLAGLRQHAFMRALGPLRRTGADTWTGTRADAGPLLVGLLRPRIVLPRDFMQRYSAQEQAAVLAHERVHRRRGDLWWNTLATLLRCAFWFHPLAPLCRRCFLADQELACDGAVLRTARHSPRVYAEALLKTQLALDLDAGAPLACAMAAASPLHERILHLSRRGSSRRALAAVALLLAACAGIGARVAWAASAQVVSVAASASSSPVTTTTKGNPMNSNLHSDTRAVSKAAARSLAVLVGAAALQAQAQAPAAPVQATPPPAAAAPAAVSARAYGVEMSVDMHGHTTQPRLVVNENAPFAIAGEQDGTPWRVEFTMRRTAQEGMLRLAARVIEGGKTLAAPVLVGPVGERMAFRVGGDVEVALLVQPLDPGRD